MTNRSVVTKITILALAGILSTALYADRALACWGNPFLQPPASPQKDVPISIIQTGTGTYRAVFAMGSTFPPASPGTSKCACGLALRTGSGLTITAASIIDMSGGLVPGFVGFAADANSTAAFQTASPAPAGFAWSGLSTTVTGAIPNGAMASLVFDITDTAPGAAMRNAAMIRPNIIGGKVGSALADLSGGNFDPGHQGTGNTATLADSSIPTLSEWGMILLVSLLVLSGSFLIVRRRRSAAAI